jgi:hypothetical protein
MNKEGEFPITQSDQTVIPEKMEDPLDQNLISLSGTIFETNPGTEPAFPTEQVIFSYRDMIQSFQERTATQRKGKRKVVWELRDKVFELIYTGLSIPEITEALHQPKYTIENDRRKIREIMGFDLPTQKPGPKPGQTQKRFLEKLEEFEREHPGEAFDMRSWAEELGVTRHRLSQLYSELEKKLTLPPKMTHKTGPKPGQTQNRLIEKLEEFGREHPGETLTLGRLTDELGVTLERLRQLYKHL